MWGRSKGTGGTVPPPWGIISPRKECSCVAGEIGSCELGRKKATQAGGGVGEQEVQGHSRRREQVPLHGPRAQRDRARPIC